MTPEQRGQLQAKLHQIDVCLGKAHSYLLRLPTDSEARNLAHGEINKAIAIREQLGVLVGSAS